MANLPDGVEAEATMQASQWAEADFPAGQLVRLPWPWQDWKARFLLVVCFGQACRIGKGMIDGAFFGQCTKAETTASALNKSSVALSTSPWANAQHSQVLNRSFGGSTWGAESASRGW
ncbi:unnamed protein product [Protopolystoma xenopodis]|uniref:Uncharacterized protein n=1 Tax=Protopolystoma xenopodis TaxID=117903 RepID=A0A448WUA4_9PLAT|nr:unnamed protein product [Protopolystoma xenopodis]